MDKELFFWNSFKLYLLEAWVLFQNMCDKVFGEDVVDIDPAPMNPVTAHFKFVDGMRDFKAHFQARLERLKAHLEDSDAYYDLIATVEKVADPDECDQAYAQLAAWDVMMDLYDQGLVGLTSYPVGVIDALPRKGNPYELAEETDEMVLNKYGDDIEDEDKQKFVVLVRTPWNSSIFKDNAIAEFIYYRNMARRSFINTSDDDLSEKLAGIIIIDEAMEDGKIHVVCHGFLNPNCEDESDVDVVKLVVEQGDETGVLEDFIHDNY